MWLKSLDLVVESNPRHFCEAAPAMTDPTLPLPGLSPVSGKTVITKFDGGLWSQSSSSKLERRSVHNCAWRFSRGKFYDKI
jgi:hypothetical protein